MTARLVVLVSGAGTNLQALLDACADPAYGAQVVAVGADRDGIEGLARAERAGIPTFVRRVDTFEDRAHWDRVLAVNLTGAFLCTREAFRVMGGQTPQGGRIINNGSIAAYAPRPRSVAYTATKHAVTGLTKAAALDGRAYNIACGQLDIGNAATEMGSGAAAGAAQADGSVRPEPLMDVAEVGRAVVYMASLPLGANVLNMTVMATKMPFVGRG